MNLDIKEIIDKTINSIREIIFDTNYKYIKSSWIFDEPNKILEEQSEPSISSQFIVQLGINLGNSIMCFSELDVKSLKINEKYIKGLTKDESKIFTTSRKYELDGFINSNKRLFFRDKELGNHGIVEFKFFDSKSSSKYFISDTLRTIFQISNSHLDFGLLIFLNKENILEKISDGSFEKIVNKELTHYYYELIINNELIFVEEDSKELKKFIDLWNEINSRVVFKPNSDIGVIILKNKVIRKRINDSKNINVYKNNNQVLEMVDTFNYSLSNIIDRKIQSLNNTIVDKIKKFFENPFEYKWLLNNNLERVTIDETTIFEYSKTLRSNVLSSIFENSRRKEIVKIINKFGTSIFKSSSILNIAEFFSKELIKKCSINDINEINKLVNERKNFNFDNNLAQLIYESSNHINKLLLKNKATKEKTGEQEISKLKNDNPSVSLNLRINNKVIKIFFSTLKEIFGLQIPEKGLFPLDDLYPNKYTIANKIKLGINILFVLYVYSELSLKIETILSKKELDLTLDFLNSINSEIKSFAKIFSDEITCFEKEFNTITRNNFLNYINYLKQAKNNHFSTEELKLYISLISDKFKFIF